MEATMKREFILGLDLGHLHDYTALVLLEKFIKIKKIGEKELRVPYFLERQARRFKLPTRTETVVKDVGRILNELPGKTKLCVDRTGVGLPTFQFFEDRLPPGKLVGIVFGREGIEETEHGNTYTVPVTNLDSALALVVEQDRLRLAGKDPETEILFKELQTHVPRGRRGRSDTQDIPWREKEHDDLFYALACGVWWGSRRILVLHYIGKDGVLREQGDPADPANPGAAAREEFGIRSTRPHGKSLFELQHEYEKSQRILEIFDDEEEEEKRNEDTANRVR